MQVSNASGPSLTECNEGGPDNENPSVAQNENATVCEESPAMFSEDSD